MGPSGKVVVVARVVECGSQQAAPEVVVDACRVDCTDLVSEFSQVLSVPAGGDRRQRAVPDLERPGRRVRFSCSDVFLRVLLWRRESYRLGAFLQVVEQPQFGHSVNSSPSAKL